LAPFQGIYAMQADYLILHPQRIAISDRGQPRNDDEGEQH
jgi:hypothetical protein